MLRVLCVVSESCFCIERFLVVLHKARYLVG